MSGELDEAFARMRRFDRFDMLLRQVLDYLDRRLSAQDVPLHQPDVPLHQRGFGLMDDEPPT